MPVIRLLSIVAAGLTLLALLCPASPAWASPDCEGVTYKQVGAFLSQGNALSAAERYDREGLCVRFERKTVGGREFHTILVAPPNPAAPAAKKSQRNQPGELSRPEPATSVMKSTPVPAASTQIPSVKQDGISREPAEPARALSPATVQPPATASDDSTVSGATAKDKPALPSLTRSLKQTLSPANETPSHRRLGAGIYANALNPSAGGTLLYWPRRSLGLQASATVGTYSILEVRTLYRMESQQRISPYLGLGYMRVKTDPDSPLVDTISASGLSFAFGVEGTISKRTSLHLEAVLSNTDLTATTSGQTVEGGFKPMSIGIAFVFYPL